MSESSSWWRSHADMIVAMSAVMIGVCALGVSLYETSLMRQEQRAAVLPLVELSRSYFASDNGENSDRLRLLLSAENVGIGPARVADFQVTVDDQPHTTWRSAFNALLGGDANVAYGQSTINGRTIPAGRTITMFDLSDTALAGDIVAQFDRLNFVACFCSVFEECWTTSYRTFGQASAVAGCQGDSTSFQE